MNVTITHKVQASINLTADEWCLYMEAGRDDVARILNKDVEKAINAASNREEAARWVIAALKMHSLYGAADSEGYFVAEQILDMAYPR
jgi:hypothetical protein